MYSYYPPMQSPMQSPLIAQAPQIVPQQQNIQYVNDRQSAESYQMSPNSSVILMDANLSRFYMKQTDASGQATIKAYDFKEVAKEKPIEYVTKAEFEAYKAKMKGGRNESVNDADRK